MSRSSKDTIKKDERELMKILETNGHMSLDALSKKAGFSRQKAWRLVRRLEQSKTVYGYHALIDRSKIGEKKFFVLIRLSMEPIDALTMASLTKDELQKKAEKYGVSIDALYFVQGRYDFCMSMIAEGIIPVKKFCYQVLIRTIKQIKTIEFLDELVTIKEDGIMHPGRDKIKEFF